jgi:carbonic anhydrase/acetyltransferase-like protein (isoleucine patch superfamily)
MKSTTCLVVALAIFSVGCKSPPKKKPMKPMKPGVELPLIRANVETPTNPDIERPNLAESTYVDSLASVIGNVELGDSVYVAPFASIRGDEGQPLFIGDDSNVQDGVVIHALETTNDRGAEIPGRTYEVNGSKYAVYIGKRVSMAHQSQVHGPAYIEDDVFVGMQALVFKAHVGRGSVIEPGAKVIGVEVPPGVYVRMGTVLNNQKDADKLPKIDSNYPFKDLNEAVVHVNTSFAHGYGDLLRDKPLKREEFTQKDSHSKDDNKNAALHPKGH